MCTARKIINRKILLTMTKFLQKSFFCKTAILVFHFTSTMTKKNCIKQKVFSS